MDSIQVAFNSKLSPFKPVVAIHLPMSEIITGKSLKIINKAKYKYEELISNLSRLKAMRLKKRWNF